MNQVIPRDRINGLVQKLLEQSRAGKIQWEDVGKASTLDIYRTKIGTGFVRITLSEDDDGRGGVQVTLLNESGLPIADTHFGRGAERSKPAEELIESARTSARGGERVLESMFEALDR